MNKILFILLMVFSASSFADTPYAMDGVCYDTNAKFTQAFREKYPKIENGIETYITTAPVLNDSTGYLTVGFRTFNMSTLALSSPTGFNFTFVSCSSDLESWRLVPTSAITFYGVLMLCFFVGVRMGFII